MMDRTYIAGKDRIVWPLDASDVNRTLDLVKQLEGSVGMFKVGPELIYSLFVNDIILEEDEAISHFIQKRALFAMLEGKIFLDVQLNDIPNTVEMASAIIEKLGVRMFNVHASSGIKAIAAAAKVKGRAKLLAATVLTSINKEECISIFGKEPDRKVLEFARMAKENGADGIVCSPQELKFLLRYKEFDDFLKVVPGIRPDWAAKNDQERVMNPYGAVICGADYIVVGRPITASGNPYSAAALVTEEIAAAESFC